MLTREKITVLVVDDSAVVRKVLSDELAKAPDIEVVGTAMDPYVARDKIVRLRPRVVTLDIEMPRMDGLTFLGKLMKYNPLPVIVVSSVTAAGNRAAARALELGAVAVVAKPGSAEAVAATARKLVESVRAAARAKAAPAACPNPSPAAPALSAGGAAEDRSLLAMGASTGGTRAIEEVLSALPSRTPGTVIVQHMPENFTRAFAERLNGLCAMEVREARDGDPVAQGVALIAPGDKHMVICPDGLGYVVAVKDGPPVYHQRPSVDVLFHSVARHAGAHAVGVLLTGMGADGAAGLKAMRDAGARTLVQDEESCVVYGMPREAVKLGAADEIVSLRRMASRIIDRLAWETVVAG